MQNNSQQPEIPFPKAQKTPKKSQLNPIHFKGITLQQYFRRCQQHDSKMIPQIEQESCSQKQSTPATPCFVNHPRERNHKLKTQVIPDEVVQPLCLERFSFKRNNNESNDHKDHKYEKDQKEQKEREHERTHEHWVDKKITTHVGFTGFRKKNEKAQKSIDHKYSKEKDREGSYIALPDFQHDKHTDNRRGGKRMLTYPSKLPNEIGNRSTLSAFYQLDKNKKKMGLKLKNDIEHANKLKLHDMFLVTKYGPRFHININKLK